MVDKRASTQFNGLSTPKIDAKGRMSLAVGFRDVLRERERVSRAEAAMLEGGVKKEEKKSGGKEKSEQAIRLFLTRGSGTRHIMCYPVDVWEQKVDKINKLPNNDKTKKLRAYVIGHSQECEIDQLGRIFITPKLREFAGIGVGEVVVMGLGETFQIWSKESYSKHFEVEDMEKQIEEYESEYDV